MWKYIHLTYTHITWLFNFLVYHSFSIHYDHCFDELLPADQATELSLTTSSTAECCVCLCKIDEGEEIRELICAHLFHKPCLDGWTGFKCATCPICRSRLAPPRSTQLQQQFDGQVEVLLFQFCSFRSDSDRGDRWWLR
ncbi:RING-H2 finger protein ATL11-like [Pyrus ussuriensis x Pyrus communis]|uniref:RING-H2 finger protein ATL11-like n=1 Tax=Pyrus ussuriensis x Pyrus communis TaxID=2448454 RepID=A0A5N5HM84_9ROSA|nr:RING-H2 finger protein ATL11-like [Pyrus ussuriensis x Pyrus communis]